MCLDCLICSAELLVQVHPRGGEVAVGRQILAIAGLDCLICAIYLIVLYVTVLYVPLTVLYVPA